MLVSLSSSDKNEKMQDDIFNHTNLKLFVNEIITYNIITIKNDLEQYELNVCKIIYVVIKKYK